MVNCSDFPSYATEGEPEPFGFGSLIVVLFVVFLVIKGITG